jgi:hypothetical protein
MSSSLIICLEPEPEASTQSIQGLLSILRNYDAPTYALVDTERSSLKDAPNNRPQADSELPHSYTSPGEESLAFLATVDKHVADAVQFPVLFSSQCLSYRLSVKASLRPNEVTEVRIRVGAISQS